MTILFLKLVQTEDSSIVLVKNCVIIYNNNADTQDGYYAVKLYNERPIYSPATGERVNVEWTGEAYNNNEMPIRHCVVRLESTSTNDKKPSYVQKAVASIFVIMLMNLSW